MDLALDAGVVTKTHLLSLLHRLVDGQDHRWPEIDTPHTLILLRKPKANVECLMAWA